MAENRINEKYAYLDQLSMEQLEELLRTDFASPDSHHNEIILSILEVMERKEEETPTGRLPEPGQAWREFQAYYNIPEGKGERLYPEDNETDRSQGTSVFASKIIEMFRVCGVVAVIMLVIFGGMLAGEACGFEAFASLGLWTDESTIGYSPSILGTYMWK